VAAGTLAALAAAAAVSSQAASCHEADTPAGALQADGAAPSKRDHGKARYAEPTLLEQLYFAVDDFLATSSSPRLAVLTASTGLLLALGSASFAWVNRHVPGHRAESVWLAWTIIADPGTHTLLPRAQKSARAVGVVFTLGGMAFFALLIGLVNDKIADYLDEVQAGQSRVLVKGHVVVAGWSSKLPSLLTEFGKDSASACAVYVVLADKPKAEIDGLLEGVAMANGARIITRTGDPSKATDLLRASPNTAASVVLLSPESEDDSEADALVMVRAMALLSLEVVASTVVEIRDKDNLPVVIG
jgi:hypothetical protein